METKKIVMGVISVAVAIVVLMSMIPIFTDAGASEDTFTNEGYARFSKTDSETVITWTPSVDRNTININGVDTPLSGFPKTFNYSYSIAFSDDFILRIYMDGAGVQNMQIWQSGYRTGMASTSTYTGTFTISSDTLSFNSGAPDAVTSTYTHTGDYFVIDPAGDQIMKPRTESAYVLEDSSIIYAGGISGVDSSVLTGFYIEGTVGEYDFTPMLSGVTVDNVQTNYTEVTDHVDLLLLENIKFDTTYNDNVIHQTYSYFLVPYEVTAERSAHASPVEATLIGLIPLLMMVGIMLTAVGLFIAKYRKN